MMIAFTIILLSLNVLPCLTQNATTWYPTYHVAPKQGWMNDPNGLVYHNGYYHAFWQYNPFNTSSGLMHWGHARSTDMMTWEYLPVALAPSRPEDVDGIFSGSAVVKDDKITIVYTGVSENSSRQRQMAAASADGVNFEKLGVIIDRDGDERDFRDPKVWWQDDVSSWFAVIGTKTLEGKGEVLLYKSLDFINWTSEGALAQADDKLGGYMWECPDFFTLGDKQILIINPQGIEQDGFDYQNLYQTGYFIGSWTPGGNYTVDNNNGFKEIDHGHDFYASQTFLAPDGRRILLAWLGMWESEFPERNTDGWAGMLTLPRELTLSPAGDKMEIRPIREIRNLLRTKRVERNDLVLQASSDNHSLLGKALFASEVVVKFNLLGTTCGTFGVEFRDILGAFEGVRVYVDRSQSRLFLERYYPQFNVQSSTRSVAVDLTLPELSLDIFIDSSSIEVFVNDGQAVMSSRIYPTDQQRSFFVYGESNGSNISISRFTRWDI